MAACILRSEVPGAEVAVDLEELEVDAGALAVGSFAAYLRDSGLTETESERVLRACRTQLKTRESAMVCVDRAAGAPRVKVRAGRERSAGKRRRSAASAPLQTPGAAAAPPLP